MQENKKNLAWVWLDTIHKTSVFDIFIAVTMTLVTKRTSVKFSDITQEIGTNLITGFVKYSIRDVFREWFEHPCLGGIIGGGVSSALSDLISKPTINKVVVARGIINSLLYELTNDANFKNNEDVFYIESLDVALKAIFVKPDELMTTVNYGAIGVLFSLVDATHIYTPSREYLKPLYEATKHEYSEIYTNSTLQHTVISATEFISNMADFTGIDNLFKTEL